MRKFATMIIALPMLALAPMPAYANGNCWLEWSDATAGCGTSETCKSRADERLAQCLAEDAVKEQ